MGAGSGISGKRALSSLRVCSTVRNIPPPQDGLILRPSHAVPDGRRAASEMSDNVQRCAETALQPPFFAQLPHSDADKEIGGVFSTVDFRPIT